MQLSFYRFIVFCLRISIAVLFYGYNSVALPLIGSGSGTRGEEWSLEVMLEAFKYIESNAKVLIIKYKKNI